MFYVLCVKNKDFIASTSSLNFGFDFTPFLKKAKRFKTLKNALRWFGTLSIDSSINDTLYLYVCDGFTIKEKIDVNFYI